MEACLLAANGCLTAGSDVRYRGPEKEQTRKRVRATVPSAKRARSTPLQLLPIWSPVAGPHGEGRIAGMATGVRSVCIVFSSMLATATDRRICMLKAVKAP